MPYREPGNPIDDRSSHLDLPLPHHLNDTHDDVVRLREALALLDSLLAAVQKDKAGAVDLAALSAELRNALGLKAGSADLATLSAELRNALGFKADADAVVRSWAGRKGDVAPVFADLGGKPATLAGYGITDGVHQKVFLNAGEDLNNATTSGFYTVGGAYANGPESNVAYGQLIVSRGADTIVQMAFPYHSAEASFRTASGIGASQKWTPWVRLANTSSPRLTGAILLQGAVRGYKQSMAGDVVDCALGNYYQRTVTGNTTFSFVNVPAADAAYSLRLDVVHAGGVIAWPGSVRWPGNVAPRIVTGRTHMFFFATTDGGNTWRGAVLPNYSA